MKNLIKSKIEKYSQTVGEKNEIDEITGVSLIIQRALGQQVLDPNWTWKRFYIYHIFNLSLFIYVFFGTLQTIWQTTDDAVLVAEAFYTIIIIVILPIKVLLVINNRHLFRELYITAKTTLLDLIKEQSDAKTILVRMKKIVYGSFGLVAIPFYNYELTTLWHYINGTWILLSRSTSTFMPMTSPYYEIAWFIHSIFLFEIAAVIIIDMVWFVLLMYFLCLASDSLDTTLKVEKGEEVASYGMRLNEGLKKFYHGHVKHVRYLSQLNSMFKWLAVMPICNAAMCICIVLLLLSKEINMRFAPNVIPMLAEVFAYNWFGELIKTKASNTKTALINFDWTSMELKDRKNYLIIISYMNKESGIKTAMGTELSLITMSAVLKFSYQAYTVLQTVGD